jgi:hypothetical protein
MELLNGESKKKNVILRIVLQPSDPTLYFMLKWRQFLIQVAFAVTTEMTQEQTFSKTLVYLLKPVFTHGQLFVTFCRVRKLRNMKVKVENKRQGIYTKYCLTQSNIIK